MKRNKVVSHKSIKLPFRKQVVSILISPKSFFRSNFLEATFKESFKFLLLLTLLSVLIGVIVGNIVDPGYRSFWEGVINMGKQQPAYVTLRVLSSLLTSVAVNLLFGFILSFGLQTWLKIFKVGSDYETSYKIYSFTRAPSLLFTGVPVLNLIGLLWSWYLLFVAILEVYSLQRKKALIMIVSGGLIILALSLVVGYFYYQSQLLG